MRVLLVLRVAETTLIHRHVVMRPYEGSARGSSKRFIAVFNLTSQNRAISVVRITLLHAAWFYPRRMHTYKVFLKL